MTKSEERLTSACKAYLRSLQPESLFVRCGRWKVWTQMAVANVEHRLYLGWAPRGEGLPDRVAVACIPMSLARGWPTFVQVAQCKLEQMELLLESAYEA